MFFSVLGGGTAHYEKSYYFKGGQWHPIVGTTYAVTYVEGSVQTTSLSAANRDNHSITYNLVSTEQDGKKAIIIGFFADGGDAPSAIPDNLIPLSDPSFGSGTQTQNLWYAYVFDTDDITNGSVTFTFTKANEMGQITAFEVEGLDVINPVADSKWDRASSTTRTTAGPVELSTPVSGCLLVTSIGVDTTSGGVAVINVDDLNGFTLLSRHDSGSNGMPSFIACIREVDAIDDYDSVSFVKTVANAAMQLEAFALRPFSPDVEAPDAPTDFVVTPGDAKNTLIWVDPEDEDLDFINIYRSLTTGTGFTLLDTVAAGVETYLDDDVVNDTTYYYYLTAVDNSDNESSQTTEQSATPEENSEPAVVEIVATGVSSLSASSNISAQSYDYPYTSTVQDGTVYVYVFFCTDSASGVPIDSDAYDNQLTPIGLTNQSNNAVWAGRYKPSQGDLDDGTLELRFTLANQAANFVCVEVSGADSTDPDDDFQVATVSSGTSIGPLSVNTSEDNGLIIVAAICDENVNITPSSLNSFSEIVVRTAGTALGGFSAHHRSIATAGSTSTPVYGGSASDRMNILAVSIKPQGD